MKSQYDKTTEEKAKDQALNINAGLVCPTKFYAFTAGRDSARESLVILARAVEYYANHESVIKEAYHSNDERQITCVHTFINHKAKEAKARLIETGNWPLPEPSEKEGKDGND